MENEKEPLAPSSRFRTRAFAAPFAALCGALAVGLAAQGVGLFNKYSWHDDIFSLFHLGATITSGRWMLHVLGELEILIFGDGHFSLPLMNGLFSLICIGLSAGILVRLLKIRSRLLSALLGGVTAAFPVVTALFGFMFTAPYYFLALLMITAGSAWICAGDAWWKKTLGTLLCACSAGVYQAFLPLLPAIILLYDISSLAECPRKGTVYLRRGGLQALCAAGALGLYLAGSRLFLSLYQMEMDSYMGLNQVGSVALADYAARVGRAFAEFFHPTRNVLWDMYPQHVHYLYLAMLCLDAGLGILLIIRLWKESPLRALLSVALLILFPLACNLIFVLSEEVHSLMVYGQAMQFALLVWLTDRADLRFPSGRRGLAESPSASGQRVPVESPSDPGNQIPADIPSGSERRVPAHNRFPSARRVLSAAVSLMLAACCVMYIRYDNQCYLKTAFQQQEAISWYTSLIARIQSAPGYRDELPVAWINRMDAKDQSLYNIDELNFIVLASYEQDIQNYVNNWAWEKFLSRWCGFAPETADPETMRDLPEVQAMPSWPDDGSVQVVHDIVVVKF